MKKRNIFIYIVLFCLITIFINIKYLAYLYIILLFSIKQFRLFLVNLYYTIIYFISFLLSKNDYRLNNNNRKEKIIVSLTTYSKRINTVFLAIESIFEQTAKPDKIVLWLDKNEFSIDTIPSTLKKQIKQGLTVDFCDNIRSYKKLIPSLKKYPDDIIITIDDDIVYKNDCIENLYNAYLEDKNQVYCNYSFKFLSQDFRPVVNENKAYFLFNYIGTGAGTLFPPHILPDEIFNEDVFMKLAPIHDDVFISLLLQMYNINLVNVNKNYKYYIKLIQKRIIINTQSIGLFKENSIKNKTKTQLLNLLNHYGIELKNINKF